MLLREQEKHKVFLLDDEKRVSHLRSGESMFGRTKAMRRGREEQGNKGSVSALCRCFQCKPSNSSKVEADDEKAGRCG